MKVRPSCFGGRRSGFGATISTLAVAISCGLSPVDDLPSATDGFNTDGITDGQDGPVSGSGGASAGSGGAPCMIHPFIYECRGDELWWTAVVPGCTVGQTRIEVCTAGCRQEQDGAACNLGGAAGEGGTAGSAGSGFGGVSVDTP